MQWVILGIGALAVGGLLGFLIPRWIVLAVPVTAYIAIALLALSQRVSKSSDDFTEYALGLFLAIGMVPMLVAAAGGVLAGKRRRREPRMPRR